MLKTDKFPFTKATTFIDSDYTFNVLEFYKDSHFLSRKITCIVLADPSYHLKVSFMNYYMMLRCSTIIIFCCHYGMMKMSVRKTVCCLHLLVILNTLRKE